MNQTDIMGFLVMTHSTEHGPRLCATHFLNSLCFEAIRLIYFAFQSEIESHRIEPSTEKEV